MEEEVAALKKQFGGSEAPKSVNLNLSSISN